MKRRVVAVVLCCALGATAAPNETHEPAYSHTTQRGDTLIHLARRYLAEPRGWPELARANRLRDANRIATGSRIDIPLRLMRSESVPAEVLRVAGDARGAGDAALAAGQALPEGDSVTTGADGQAVLRLVDGTVLRLRSGSSLRLRESRRLPDAEAQRSSARLERGRVDVQATRPAAGRPGFEISTPQGVLAVRGTEFRVAVESDTTRSEVLSGVVAAGATEVSGGFGTLIDTRGRVSAPQPLLAAPPTAALPALQERVLLRFALPALAGAVAWRAQLLPAAPPQDLVLADLRSTGTELRLADVADGDYVLRLRGVDANGLEGRDALHAFRLKARPEAPLPTNPQPGAQLFGDRVEFSWAQNPEAQSYRLQIAADAAFSQELRESAGLTEPLLALGGLATQRYHWRVASVRGADDRGPWGDARSFELRPQPPTPPPAALSDSSVSFAWEARPGQTFDFQLARDAAFNDRVVERRLDAPRIEVPLSSLPGPGRYFVRLRAIEADGFVGPFSAVQQFELQNCVRDGSQRCVSSGEQTLRLQ